jgi:hypothetical protein
MSRRNSPTDTAGDLDDAWLEGGAADIDPTITDRHGLSVMIGIAPKDIDRALRDGMPTHGRRERGTPLQFSVPACVQWLLRKQDQGGATLEGAKHRERAAMARRREIEADKLEGRLVSIDEVEAAITDQVQKLQSELLAIPVRLVAPSEIRDAVKAEIVAAVGRLTVAGRSHVQD